MIAETFAIIGVLAGAAGETTKSQGLEIGNRLIAAIKGRRDFENSDFIRPLREADKLALRQFARCVINEPLHGLTADPKRPMTFVRDFNSISITMRCKGAPSGMPVGISLLLESGKVKKVETHNADLMRLD